LDPTLIPVVDVTAGLKPGGWIIVNTDHKPSAFASLAAQGWRVATVDAADIAARHKLGARTNPIVNTAILGAFAQVTGLVKLESIVQAIEEGVPVKPNQNREAAREAFASVQMPLLEGVAS
jgi:2-oxoacid:acceptor oxidoreductase gamma subunit (pyruvate/2-ketoisovalerate family)